MLIFFFFVLMIPLADYIIKNNITRILAGGVQLDTFIPFLKITNVKNTGAAFGLFKGQTLFLVLVALAAMVFLFAVIFKKKNRDRFFIISISFIAGGAIGNLLDRLIFGYVVDYIKLTFFPPVCNLSDFFICTGAFLAMVYYLKNSLDG